MSVIRDVRVLELPEVRLVGLAFNPEPDGWGQIAALWYALCHRMREIDGIAEVGVSYGYPHPSPSFPEGVKGIDSYLAGVPVLPDAPLPPGMVEAVVPAGSYAVFEVAGALPSIGPAYDFINREWMPGSGYEEARCGAVEVYGPRFVPGASCGFEIRVAVQARGE